jgi:hypothetical protein
MATVTLNDGSGRTLTVGDEFLKLSPDEQQTWVNEVGQKLGPQPQDKVLFHANLPKMPAAIGDIRAEVAGREAQAIQHLTGSSVSDLPGYDPRTRGQLGPIEGLVRSGKQLAALPEMAWAIPEGILRSLIGHGMTSAEHAVGMAINPTIAAKDDPQKMYQTSAEDVSTALAAAKPAGMPIKASPSGFIPPGRFEIPRTEPSFQWRPPEQPSPSVEELKDAAEKNYKSAAVKSLVIKPTAIRDFGNAAEISLTDAGHSDQFAQKTFNMLRNLQRVPENSYITGDNINTLRKAFRRASESNDPSERAAAQSVINQLDTHLGNISPSDVISGDLPAATRQLTEARGNWAAAQRAGLVDRKVAEAETRAAVAGSGMNTANRIRQKMAEIYLDPKAMSGYNEDEQALIKKIVMGTPTENVVRAAGNLMGGGGGLGAAVVGGIGAMTTPGGIGGTIPIGGALLKSLSNRMTLSQADKLSELLRSRAPLASSAQKYEEAVSNMQRNPAASFTGVTLAARNLSNNLRDAGIDIAASDLLSRLRKNQGEK